MHAIYNKLKRALGMGEEVNVGGDKEREPATHKTNARENNSIVSFLSLVMEMKVIAGPRLPLAPMRL